MAAPIDIDELELVLQAAARAGVAVTYSEALMALGMAFSRPRMRALCKMLDAIDARGAARGQPELAVLVVRAADGLPGQGWWVGRSDYRGAWIGPEAQAFVAALQARAFDYWAGPPAAGA